MKFFDSKYLLVNKKNIRFIFFVENKKNLQPTKFFRKTLLEQVEHTFLGLKIDKILSRDKHIDHVISKMSSECLKTNVVNDNS